MTELTGSPTSCEIGVLDDSLDFSSPTSYHLNPSSSTAVDSNTAYLNQVCLCICMYMCGGYVYVCACVHVYECVHMCVDSSMLKQITVP